ncbi:MAG: hypothetical protein O2884_01665 [Chloroflexi bacterium]|nr:hypothetical protein [Chloroflexota bacterium]
MTARIEWRTNGKGDDALIYVGEFGEDSNTVLRTWEADAAHLTDFLNKMTGFATDVVGLEVDAEKRDPLLYGRLVMTRSPHGQVMQIDPELYWDAIYYWFRSNGSDPHPMRELTT